MRQWSQTTQPRDKAPRRMQCIRLIRYVPQMDAWYIHVYQGTWMYFPPSTIRPTCAVWDVINSVEMMDLQPLKKVNGICRGTPSRLSSPRVPPPQRYLFVTSYARPNSRRTYRRVPRPSASGIPSCPSKTKTAAEERAMLLPGPLHRQLLTSPVLFGPGQRLLILIANNSPGRAGSSKHSTYSPLLRTG